MIGGETLIWSIVCACPLLKEKNPLLKESYPLTKLTVINLADYVSVAERVVPVLLVYVAKRKSFKFFA